MNYKISSSSFDQPLLKPMLEELSGFLSTLKIKFYVIGAVARDIIMQTHGEKPGRVTQDLAIAIAISKWQKKLKARNRTNKYWMTTSLFAFKYKRISNE
jgi:predicted nucleotidyltransferase